MTDLQNGKNIDVYTTFLVNAVLAVLSLLDLVPFQIFSAVLLGSMSWLILNALGDRKENQKQLSNIEVQLKRVVSKHTAEDFFTENYVTNSEGFNNSLRGAKELWVLGQGQNRMITAHSAQIRRILSEGGTVKFLLGTPDGIGTEMSVTRSSTVPNIERIKQEHWAAVERLKSLARLPEAKGTLEVRFIDLFMPYTMYGFDVSNLSKASLYIWITPLKEPSERRPGFSLHASRDQQWFSSFKRQFELMWESNATTAYDIMA